MNALFAQLNGSSSETSSICVAIYAETLLVVPTGKGPFAAILFGHWGNGTRAEFIPEAKTYARAGAVSLIPDYPWDRPEPWHKSPDHFNKPELDREIYIRQWWI